MEASPEKSEAAPEAPKPKRLRKWLRRIGIVFLIFVVLGVAARLAMPSFVRAYVNRTLDLNPLYDGKIGDIEIDLWRGAYTINEVRLVKTTGDVPVPLFAAKKIDLAIEWPALREGRIVGRVRMIEPELNFVDAEQGGDAQTGVGGPWLDMLRDLLPFKINSVVIDNGSIHFRTYQKERMVDVYIAQLNAHVDNLTNIHEETAPLITTVHATGLAMDQAKFEYNMKLDPFSYRPSFNLAVQLIGLDVTKINDLALAYGNFDFKRGWFDLVIEMDAKEGQVEGYVKPLFRNLQIISLKEDLERDNVVQFFWRSLVGVATAVLTNQQREQFGTVIPFSGDLNSPQNDILAMIGGVLQNAFIRAYLPRLEATATTDEKLKFAPPTIEDPTSVGD